MKVLIKVVPDAEPNADGEWIEVDADPVILSPGNKWTGVEAVLGPLAPEGHHVVSYKGVSREPPV